MRSIQNGLLLLCVAFPGVLGAAIESKSENIVSTPVRRRAPRVPIDIASIVASRGGKVGPTKSVFVILQDDEDGIPLQVIDDPDEEEPPVEEEPIEDPVEEELVEEDPVEEAPVEEEAPKEEPVEEAPVEEPVKEEPPAEEEPVEEEPPAEEEPVEEEPEEPVKEEPVEEEPPAEEEPPKEEPPAKEDPEEPPVKEEPPAESGHDHGGEAPAEPPAEEPPVEEEPPAEEEPAGPPLPTVKSITWEGSGCPEGQDETGSESVIFQPPSDVGNVILFFNSIIATLGLEEAEEAECHISIEVENIPPKYRQQVFDVRAEGDIYLETGATAVFNSSIWWSGEGNPVYEKGKYWPNNEPDKQVSVHYLTDPLLLFQLEPAEQAKYFSACSANDEPSSGTLNLKVGVSLRTDLEVQPLAQVTIGAIGIESHLVACE